MTDKYSKLRQIYKDGDWVYGIGEHKGCSQVFDSNKPNIQPFSYLNSTNPDDFRLASPSEIEEADKKINTRRDINEICHAR